MKTVLITGATGFIGRNCIPALISKGYEVHAVSSKSAECGHLDVFWHQADLHNPVQVLSLLKTVKPTDLLHLAWYVEPGKYWTSPENLRWVQSSLDLLQAFVLEGGNRVVMAGTCAEYDWRYGYCSENTTPLAPATLYGTCKQSLQALLGAFANQAKISSAWGRIFYLYGPHEHHDRLISSVITSLLKGEPTCCSHGNQIRDLLYVEDVAEAFVALLDSEVSGPVNIGSGQPISLRDVIYGIAEKLGREDLIRLGALSTPKNDPPLLVADVSRLNGEVGWSPKYDLDQGLEETISWWRDHLKRV